MEEIWEVNDEGDGDLIATCEMEDLGKQLDKVSFGTISWNARSWNEMKKDGLMRMLKDSETEVDVICIQEVWGTNNVTEIEGYHAPIARTRDAKGKVNAKGCPPGRELGSGQIMKTTFGASSRCGAAAGRGAAIGGFSPRPAGRRGGRGGLSQQLLTFRAQLFYPDTMLWSRLSLMHKWR